MKGKHCGKNNPLFGKHLTEEHRKKISDAKKNPSEETRKKMRDAKKGKPASISDDGRARISKFNKEKVVSLETRKRMSDAQKGNKLSEETKKRIGDANRNPSKETLDRMCSASKGRSNGAKNPMYGMTGERSPAWKGGLSFEPYCEKFNEAFKEYIREKFERICFMCPTTEEENRRKLSVHHVSYDKECMCNGVECEFVPLCSVCHAKVNFGRDLWERLIINTLRYEGWI
jgi:hypothetical protein